MAKVLLLATLATKAEEAGYLSERLEAAGVSAQVIDISLISGGKTLDGAAKCTAMEDAARRALNEVTQDAGAEVVLGIGGGTGGEIILQVMRAMPITFPKLLVTTLPFDPRFAVADNAITIVPTLADLAGLNDMLRDTLDNAALMAAGICRKARKGELSDIAPSVGITALGATQGAVEGLTHALSAAGRETTVFHSNGFGGAAFARFAAQGAFDAIVDLTPHEVTRLHIAGVYADMPTRFSAGGDLPRILLPGAINFIGLGQKSLVQDHYLSRPHYAHSALFTHVKLTQEEMAQVSLELAASLNALAGPCAVIVPMGGFSHHDRPGGAIEDADLREVCLETLRAGLHHSISLTVIDAHISDPETTGAILAKLSDLSA